MFLSLLKMPAGNIWRKEHAMIMKLGVKVILAKTNRKIKLKVS